MTTELQMWLKQATRHLSRDSAAQVRIEIHEHYQASRDAAMGAGSTSEEADRLAIAALGSAKTANRQYRSVLLRSAEASLLREGNWEARAVCSRPWLKTLLATMPAAALLAAAAFSFFGGSDIARILLAGGIVMGFLFSAPFLPLYTPARGRAFRVVKWLALSVVVGVAYQGIALKWSWLIFSGLWPLVWTEWTRFSIRRKLPVAQWPRQLYL
jgi:hypothetical protein